MLAIRHEKRSETLGAAGDCRRLAVAQLMSVTSSPGRTWPSFTAKRQLPVLVAALAAAFPHGGACGARLSGLAREAPAASAAHRRSQDDFRRQSGSERARYGLVGCVMVSLLVRNLLRQISIKRDR